MASHFAVTVIGALVGGIIGAVAYESYKGEAGKSVPFTTSIHGDFEALKAELKGEMERMIPEFLQAHPEIIPQTMQAAMMAEQKKQQEAAQKAVAENQTKIFDSARPHVGEGKVPMAVFFDYNCGYCKKAEAEIDKVLPKGGVTVYYVDLPILSPVSEKAAKAALAAHKQGKYKEVHDKLINSKERLNDEIIMAVLQEVGLNADQAKGDMESPEIADQIKQNMELAQILSLSGTPALVVGDQLVPGFAPAEAMEVLIAQEGGSSEGMKSSGPLGETSVDAAPATESHVTSEAEEAPASAIESVPSGSMPEEKPVPQAAA